MELHLKGHLKILRRHDENPALCGQQQTERSPGCSTWVVVCFTRIRMPWTCPAPVWAKTWVASSYPSLTLTPHCEDLISPNYDMTLSQIFGILFLKYNGFD